MYVTRDKKHYESEEHPVLKGGLEKLFPTDQLFSVESSLDSVVPWLEYVTGISGKKVFIFGTGLGGTAVACALHVDGGKVYGVDISEDAIRKTMIKAEAYGAADKLELYHSEDTYPLKYEDNYFDISVIAAVIEHIVTDRKKYLREVYRVTKENGIILITGTPNIIYPKDMHTTGLYFLPWLPRKAAYRYALKRGKWVEGKDLELAGRKGTSYWHIKRWLKGLNYKIINLEKGFTSNYIRQHGRLMTRKRKLLFLPYRAAERILSGLFRIPIAAFLPYINHLYIRKIK